MSEILAKIGFDWQIALANIINFALVFILLHHIVFKKIAKHLRERRESINQGLESAVKAESSLMMARAESDELVTYARADAHSIRSEAQSSARSILDNVQSQQNKILSEYKEKTRSELERLRSEDMLLFRDQAGQHVIQYAETLLKQQMSNPTLAREYISTAISS